MAASNLTAFTAFDDAGFSQLVKDKYISAGNSLADCLPSSLNFTSASSCLATLDLMNRNLFALPKDGSEIIPVTRDFLQLLPTQLQDATILDILGYMSLLPDLGRTQEVINGAIQYCTSNGLLATQISDLDFTQDCPATGHFWWRFIAPNVPDVPSSSDFINVFLPALPSVYSNYANETILAAVGNLTTNPNVTAMIGRAADICAPEACLALDYSGNADIAGSGAIVTYASIAFVTTVVTTVCVYYYRIDHGDINRKVRSRYAAIQSSLLFGDTVIYFTIMTSLATDIYINNAKSLYELCVGSLVAFMAFCATALICLLDLYPQGEDIGVRFLARTFAIVMSSNVAITIVSSLSNIGNNVKQYVDYQCYGLSPWPVPIVTICGWATIATWIIYSILTISVGYRKWHHSRFGKEKKQRFFEIMSTCDQAMFVTVSVLAVIILWANLACIIYIRQRSRNAFGSSYDDESFGYGQIMASGFVLQVVLQYLALRIWRSNKAIGQSNGEVFVNPLQRRETQLSRIATGLGSVDPEKTIAESITPIDEEANDCANQGTSNGTGSSGNSEVEEKRLESADTEIRPKQRL